MSTRRAPTPAQPKAPAGNGRSSLEYVLTVGLSNLQVGKSVGKAWTVPAQTCAAPVLGKKMNTFQQEAVGVKYSHINEYTTPYQIDEMVRALSEEISGELCGTAIRIPDAVKEFVRNVLHIGTDLARKGMPTRHFYVYLLNVVLSTVEEVNRMIDPQKAQSMYLNDFTNKWNSNVRSPAVDGNITTLAKSALLDKSISYEALRYFTYVNNHIFNFFQRDGGAAAPQLTRYLDAVNHPSPQDQEAAKLLLGMSSCGSGGVSS